MRRKRPRSGPQSKPLVRPDARRLQADPRLMQLEQTQVFRRRRVGRPAEPSEGLSRPHTGYLPRCCPLARRARPVPLGWAESDPTSSFCSLSATHPAGHCVRRVPFHARVPRAAPSRSRHRRRAEDRHVGEGQHEAAGEGALPDTAGTTIVIRIDRDDFPHPRTLAGGEQQRDGSDPR